MTAATTETVIDPFLTEEFHTDPNAVIARMRAEDPVHQISGLGAWMVTRYDDVRALFTHPDATNDRRAYAHYQLPSDPMARWIAENSLFAASPEQHARQRNLVATAFTPRAVKRMENQVRAVIQDFAAPLRGRKGKVDLYAEFTEPIPNTVIGRITGVPPNGSDELRWRQLGRDAVRGVSPFLTPEELEERHKRRSEELERARTALVDPLVESAMAEGVKASAIIRYGHVTETIADIAEKEGAAQIFMGRTGHGSLAKILFGSVAAAMAQIAPVPCTIVP